MAIPKPSNSYEVKKADGTIVYRKNIKGGYVDISKETGQIAGGVTTSTSGGTKTITPIYSREAESKLQTALQSGTSGEVIRAGRELVASGGTVTITTETTTKSVPTTTRSFKDYFNPAIKLNPTNNLVSTQSNFKAKVSDLRTRFEKRFPLTTDIYRFMTKRGPEAFKESAQRGAITLGNYGAIVFKQRGLTFGEEQKIKRFTGGGFEVQKTITGAYIGGVVGGKVIVSSPGLTKALASTSGKALGYVGTGAYGVATYKAVKESETPGLTLAKSVGGFAGFTGGMKRGLSGIKLSVLTPKSNAKVRVLEFGKTTTRAKSFGVNTLDFYRGKPTIFIGGAKSGGVSLVKVNNKQYRILFKETGLSKNVGEATLTRGTSTLNIQQYETTLFGRKVPFGKLRKASFVSETLSIPGESETTLRGIAKIKTKGIPQTTRVSLAKATQTGETTTFKGYNIDAFRGKIISGSQKVIKGISKEIFTANKGEATYSISKGTTFSRDISGLNREFKLNPISNLKRFNRNEFISGANKLVYGTKSITPTTSITQADVKTVAQQQYKLDIATNRMKTLQEPKVISISKPTSITTTRTSGVSLNRIVPTTKTYTETKFNVVTKPIVSTSTINKIKPIPDTITKIGIRGRSRTETKIIPDIMVKQSTIPATIQRQQTIQRTILKQTTKGRTYFSIPTIPKIRVGGIAGGFKTFAPKMFKTNFRRIKTTRIKGGYSPTIEATLFNVRAKKVSKKEAESGLLIRPILRG